MDIKTTKTVEAVFTIADLKEILSEKLGMAPEDVSISETTKTEMVLGYDIHDADYIQIFTGIKLTYKE